MKIAVSACLLGRNCKYNGGSNRCEAVLEFCRTHKYVTGMWLSPSARR